MTNLDRVLKMVAEMNEKSHHSTELEGPDENGIRWAFVGHNATHSFEIGVDAEDQLWSRASGPEYDMAAFEKAFPVNHPGQVLRERNRYKHLSKCWKCFSAYEVYVTSPPRRIEAGAGVYLGHW